MIDKVKMHNVGKKIMNDPKMKKRTMTQWTHNTHRSRHKCKAHKRRPPTQVRKGMQG